MWRGGQGRLRKGGQARGEEIEEGRDREGWLEKECERSG